MSQRHPWWTRAIRVAGLCLFVAYLFRSQGTLEETFELLSGIHPGFWALGFATNLLPPLVVAVRLKNLLAAAGHPLPYGVLASDSLRATALNTVTLMGAGDLYRINRMRAQGVPLATGASLAVLDRLFGVGTLIVIAAVVQLSGLGQGFEVPRGWVSAAAGIMIFIGVGIVLFRRPVAQLAQQRIAFLAPVWHALTTRPIVLARLFGLSLAVCTAWILSVYFLGLGLGLTLGPIAYLEAAPLVGLATLIPITIGGVGLREAGYLLLLGSHGATLAQCIALGLAQYSTFVALAAVGGVLFAIPRGRDVPVTDDAR